MTSVRPIAQALAPDAILPASVLPLLHGEAKKPAGIEPRPFIPDQADDGLGCPLAVCVFQSCDENNLQAVRPDFVNAPDTVDEYDRRFGSGLVLKKFDHRHAPRSVPGHFPGTDSFPPHLFLHPQALHHSVILSTHVNRPPPRKWAAAATDFASYSEQLSSAALLPPARAAELRRCSRSWHGPVERRRLCLHSASAGESLPGRPTAADATPPRLCTAAVTSSFPSLSSCSQAMT